MRIFRTIAIVLSAALLSTALRTDAAPVGRSSDTVQTIDLEDPLTPQSRCYIDLDTGNTFERGESSGDVMQSSAWIRTHGIDLMCESREPANGLVAYDMAMLVSNASVDHPPEFATVRSQFTRVESQHFDFFSLESAESKTWLFRSGDGQFGILELSAKPSAPSGMRVRFRAIQPRRPDVSPAIREAMTNPLARVDPRLMSLWQMKTALEVQLHHDESTYGPRHPKIVTLQQALFTTNRRIREVETELRNHPATPATKPAEDARTVTPATRPFAEDFHL